MALAVTIKKKFKFGNGFGVVADVAFDSSYPTNGESLEPGLLGLTELDFILPSTAAGYMFEYDHTNKKLKAVHPRAAISSTLAVSAHAAGATPVTSDAATMATHTLSGVAGVAAGAGEEVANETNLSTVTVRIIGIGI